MNANEWLTHFSKAREQIVGRVKVPELSSVQGTQSSDGELSVMERFPSRAERLSVIELVNDGNHAPIFQAQNYSSSANSQ